MIYDQGFGNQEIIYESSRCLPNRNSSAGCKRCLAACPSRAVKIVEGKICHDPVKCENCGTCRAVCPSEAFTVQSLSSLSELCLAPGEELALGCSLNPANKRDFNVRCYAFLMEGELLYLLHKKKRVFFNTENCENCRYQRGSAEFLKRVNLIRDILKDSDRICICSGDVNKSGVSRRFFLSWLQRRALTVIADFLPFEQTGALSQIPRGRQALIAGLINLEGELIDKIFVRRILSLSSCTGCRGCVHVCPCGAISFDGDKLLWQAKACLNCGLCIHTCPEGALYFGGGVSRAEFFQQEVLVEIKGKQCSCGVYFYSQDEVCENCAARRQLHRLSI